MKLMYKPSVVELTSFVQVTVQDTFTPFSPFCSPGRDHRTYCKTVWNCMLQLFRRQLLSSNGFDRINIVNTREVVTTANPEP
jgi:hypothetical protein